MGGRIVSLAIFPECELVLMLLGEYLPNAPSLPLGARLSTSYPLRLGWRWGYSKAPLSHPKKQQWSMVVCQAARDLREVEEALTFFAFKKISKFCSAWRLTDGGGASTTDGGKEFCGLSTLFNGGLMRKMVDLCEKFKHKQLTIPQVHQWQGFPSHAKIRVKEFVITKVI